MYLETTIEFLIDSLTKSKKSAYDKNIYNVEKIKYSIKRLYTAYHVYNITDILKLVQCAVFLFFH